MQTPACLKSFPPLASFLLFVLCALCIVTVTHSERDGSKTETRFGERKMREFKRILRRKDEGTAGPTTDVKKRKTPQYKSGRKERLDRKVDGERDILKLKRKGDETEKATPNKEGKKRLMQRMLRRFKRPRADSSKRIESR